MVSLHALLTEVLFPVPDAPERAGRESRGHGAERGQRPPRSAPCRGRSC